MDNLILKIDKLKDRIDELEKRLKITTDSLQKLIADCQISIDNLKNTDSTQS